MYSSLPSRSELVDGSLHVKVILARRPAVDRSCEWD